MLRRLLPYAAIFLFLQTLLRLSLLARAVIDLEFSAFEIVLSLAKGLWFDAVAVGFVLLPIAFYHVLLPAQKHGSKCDRKIDAGMRFVFSYMMLFDGVAEHLFWSEFSTRFNFIAVDYLIYTQEVIGNIVESYPLFWLLSGIALATVFVAWASLRALPLVVVTRARFPLRAAQCALFLLGCSALNVASDIDQATIKDNAEATEIAANGIYNLFHAFWHNEIRYDRFYATDQDKIITQNARDLLWEKDEDVKFVHDDGKDLTRLVRMAGAEKYKNVMLVVMESMSASYMEAFGSTQNITPNLDRLAKEGLFFTNLYATGTRTVRGLEAVTLSIPPTPGQSILRRPDNGNLFSLGFIMQDRGYDTKFIYGGYGYFDNMNTFFAGNGFDILYQFIIY